MANSLEATRAPWATKLKQLVLRTATLALVSALFSMTANATETSTTKPLSNPGCAKLLNEAFPRLQDDQPQSLCQYAGKVILVVNTASYCGFTRQYDGLERLYERYKNDGFVILGFPSNDFGQQEPESNKKIADFCRNTYGIKFPMFAKSNVRGSEANPLFQALTKQTGEAPGWNFHKYLIGRDGKTIQSFGSQITPESLTMTNAIVEQLRAPR